MASSEILRIDAVERTEKTTERQLVVSDDQVIVIVHQNPPVAMKAGFVETGGQKCQKAVSLLVVFEYGSAVDAARHRVMAGTGHMETGFS